MRIREAANRSINTSSSNDEDAFKLLETLGCSDGCSLWHNNHYTDYWTIAAAIEARTASDFLATNVTFNLSFVVFSGKAGASPPCDLPPTAVLTDGDWSYYSYRLKGNVNESDIRMDALRRLRGFERYTPMPGTVGYGLALLDPSASYDVNEIVKATGALVTPMRNDSIPDGCMIGSATFRDGANLADWDHLSFGAVVPSSKSGKKVLPAFPNLGSFLDRLTDQEKWNDGNRSVVLCQFSGDKAREDAIEVISALRLVPEPHVDEQEVLDFCEESSLPYILMRRYVRRSQIKRADLVAFDPRFTLNESGIVSSYLTKVKKWPADVATAISIEGQEQTEAGHVVNLGHPKRAEMQILIPIRDGLTLGELPGMHQNALRIYRNAVEHFDYGPSFSAESLDPLQSVWLPTGDDEDYQVTVYSRSVCSWRELFGMPDPEPACEKNAESDKGANDASAHLHGKGNKVDDDFAGALKVIKAACLDPAYDTFNQRAIFRAKRLPWPDAVGRELNEDTVRFLRHWILEQTGITFTKEDLFEACHTLAQKNRFSPPVEYFSKVQPTWDGVPRLDNLLITYAGAENTPYTRAIGRIVMIAVVRRARHPGTKFDTVLILEGAQGTAKSTFVRVLAGEWFSDAELGKLDNKDSAIALMGVLIQELPELSGMTRGEVTDWKAYTSRSEDRYRPPYERTVRTVPRQCIFIGTTNDSGYLMDLTGNRRYWPVKTTKIDIEALRRDRDQLFAEAAHREAKGESIVLPEELWKVAADQQSIRTIDDPWKDCLCQYLEGETRVHTKELLQEALGLDAHQVTQATAKRLRAVMMSIGGWEPKRAIRIGETIAAGYERLA